MTSGEEFIFDCTAKDFEALVIKSEVPVLVDFWAPWCQPCMQMKPILEKLIRERGGKIALAKVNVDVEQRLAMAFGISSIPDVLIFRDGRPIDRIQGILPEKALAQLLDGLLPTKEENMADLALAREQSGDLAGAEALYREALKGEEFLDQARVGLARILLARGEKAEVMTLLDSVSGGGPLGEEALALKARAWFAEKVPGPADIDAARAKAASATGKAKAQARYELGCRLAAAGEYELALEELIEAAEGDQALLTGPAREAMIQVFHGLGDAHPVTQDYRSRLMMLLC
jgi:putative thioredoxin